MQAMLNYPTLSRAALEDIVLDFLVEQWQALYRPETRALAEMLGCATQSGWGHHLQDAAAEELQPGAAALNDCAEMYRAKHAITKFEISSALAYFVAMNSTAPAEMSVGMLRHISIGAAKAAR